MPENVVGAGGSAGQSRKAKEKAPNSKLKLCRSKSTPYFSNGVIHCLTSGLQYECIQFSTHFSVALVMPELALFPALSWLQSCTVSCFTSTDKSVKWSDHFFFFLMNRIYFLTAVLHCLLLFGRLQIHLNYYCYNNANPVGVRPLRPCISQLH